MKTQLITALESICPGNVYLQGSMSADGDYPDEFITFWTNYTEDHAHLDNDVVSIDWQFSVIYYSSNPSDVGTKPSAIITTLKNIGFIPQGKGRDIPSDLPTHTGWVIDFLKTEYIN